MHAAAANWTTPSGSDRGTRFSELTQITPANVATQDKVIVGNAGGEFGIRGWVQALNVNTGKPLWKAYGTGPDADVLIGRTFHPFYAKDRGTDLGATTWPGSMWRQGGSTSWAWFTYDPDLNLLYYGTANPGVWNPDMRPGDNEWGSMIFARNPDTGEAVWAYQITPHDGWDYDSVNESIVTTPDIAGVSRKVVIHSRQERLRLYPGCRHRRDRRRRQVRPCDLGRSRRPHHRRPRRQGRLPAA